MASLSKDPTIRIYNKKKTYNEWQFIYNPMMDTTNTLIKTPYQPTTIGGSQVGTPASQMNGQQQNNQSPFGQQGSSSFGQGNSSFGNQNGVADNLPATDFFPVAVCETPGLADTLDCGFEAGFLSFLFLCDCLHLLMNRRVPHIGALSDDGRIVDLNAAHRLYSRERNGKEDALAADMRALFEGGDRSLDAARAALEYVEVQKPEVGVNGEPVRYQREKIHVKAPIIPKKFFHTAGNFREHHHEAEKAGFSHPVLPWIMFFQNVDAIIGPDEPVIFPPHLTQELDYELELAVVLKKVGQAFHGRASRASTSAATSSSTTSRPAISSATR